MEIGFEDYKNKVDSVIRAELNAPKSAFGFLAEKTYRSAYDKNKNFKEFGKEQTATLIKQGWTY